EAEVSSLSSILEPRSSFIFDPRSSIFDPRSSRSSAAPAEQIAKDGMGRIVQRFQMPNLDVFLQNCVRKILKEAARVPSPDDQGVGIGQIDADNIGLIQ